MNTPKRLHHGYFLVNFLKLGERFLFKNTQLKVARIAAILYSNYLRCTKFKYNCRIEGENGKFKVKFLK